MLSAVIGMAAPTALVLRFPPAQNYFYPRCPLYEYLHLQCPGCGATRAFAALLHGHLRQALHLNALFVSILPLIAAYATVTGYRAWTSDTFRWPEVNPPTTYALLAVVTAFTLARDL